MKAAPATKIDGVTLTVTAYGEWIFGKAWLVDHGVFQMKGNSIDFELILHIPGQGDLVGTGSTFAWGWIKFTQEPPDPDAVSNQQVKTTYTFTGEGTTGTFEGIGHRTDIGFPMVTYQEQRMVFRGTGDFRGQTLVLSTVGGPSTVPEGYLLIPH